MAIVRDEAFLDAVNIESLSGLTYGVTRPASHASNPLWPTLPESDVNHNVGYSSSFQVGSVTRLYFTAFDQNATYAKVGYAESSDGLVFTRPNLGQVMYGGNKNNNLILPLDTDGVTDIFGHVIYEPTLTATPWIAVGRTGRVATMPIVIWTSADGITFTRVKTVASNTFEEANALWRRPDGRWVIYFQDTDSVRNIGMYLSDTTDLTGAWTRVGRILAAASADEQLYHAGAWVDGELVYVPVGIFDGSGAPPIGTFNGTDNRIWKVRLYVGRATDGSVLTQVDNDWIATSGVYGEWLGGEIVCGNNVCRRGDNWNLYVGGDSNTHHQDPEGDRLLGLFTLGYRRIGKVSGASGGTVILDSVTLDESSTVTVNSTGTVELELLDPGSGLPITGFARADCDTIPADTVEHVVSWAGETLTPSSYKVKAYLSTGAVLYHVTIEDAEFPPAPPADPLTIDASSPEWEQTGTTITVNAPPAVRTEVDAVAYSAYGGTMEFAGTSSDRFALSLDDGETWASQITLPVGETAIKLSVVPLVSDGGTLSVRVGVPL